MIDPSIAYLLRWEAEDRKARKQEAPREEAIEKLLSAQRGVTLAGGSFNTESVFGKDGLPMLEQKARRRDARRAKKARQSTRKRAERRQARRGSAA